MIKDVLSAVAFLVIYILWIIFWSNVSGLLHWKNKPDKNTPIIKENLKEVQDD